MKLRAFTARLSATLTLAASVALCALLATPAQAGTAAVNVTGAASVDQLGSPSNTVWLISLGAGETLTSVTWDVDLDATAPSLLSDLQVSFGPSDGLDLLTLAPAALDSFSGSGHYSGSLDLSGLGLQLGADGLLRLEFSEFYKDGAPGVSEGSWMAGTLSFTSAASGALPEPGSVALVALGLGALVTGRRRRAPSAQ